MAVAAALPLQAAIQRPEKKMRPYLKIRVHIEKMIAPKKFQFDICTEICHEVFLKLNQ
jgi:hypothetical protein